jgi:TetR/AcrR family transcriptional repressor of nem operon
MARPREFDADDALAAAMDVFWDHGYDAASLRELLSGMGLTRGSLYKAFVDKKSLFLKVLDRYEAEAVIPAVVVLTMGPSDGLERIDRVFESVVDTAQKGDRRGCLLCSAAAGPAAVDEDIAKIVHAQLEKMRQAFEEALAASKTWKAADAEKRSATASLLLSQYVGARILVRSNVPTSEIKRSLSALQRVIR